MSYIFSKSFYDYIMTTKREISLLIKEKSLKDLQADSFFANLSVKYLIDTIQNFSEIIPPTKQYFITHGPNPNEHYKYSWSIPILNPTLWGYCPQMSKFSSRHEIVPEIQNSNLIISIEITYNIKDAIDLEKQEIEVNNTFAKTIQSIRSYIELLNKEITEFNNYILHDIPIFIKNTIVEQNNRKKLGF